VLGKENTNARIKLTNPVPTVLTGMVARVNFVISKGEPNKWSAFLYLTLLLEKKSLKTRDSIIRPETVF